MSSEQSGAEHAQNCGDDSGLQEKPPLSILYNTVSAVETFRFLGSTISEDLKWVCSLHIHYCLVWIGHQTGQKQTTMDNQDCRKNHWCGPALHSGLTYRSRVRKRTGNITADPPHPGHQPFQLFASDRRHRALYAKITRHLNSFFPQAVTLMNT